MIKEVDNLNLIRIAYYNEFRSLPQKMRFYFNSTQYVFFLPTQAARLWIYNGYTWQAVTITKWTRARQLRVFRWTKQVAIFKKKQFLKKNK